VVGLAIGLAACAGLRAWLPLLLTGLLARTGFVHIGSSFEFIASNRALALFGLATVLEIMADKIPVVDHALDALSTVLRPAAATLLAASVFGPYSDPLTALTLGAAVGAPSALLPHAGKVFLRAASTTFTAGLANPILSVLEDVLAACVFVLAVLVPLLTVVLVLLAGFWAARRMLRRSPPPSLVSGT